jgi:hypothetical protein
MKESDLYCYASMAAFAAFLVCVCYILSGNKSLKSPENTIVIVLGLLSLARSMEYYEKKMFKLTNNH